MNDMSHVTDLRTSTFCIKQALAYQRNVTRALNRGLPAPSAMARHLTKLTVAASFLHRAYHTHAHFVSWLESVRLRRIVILDEESLRLIEDVERRQLVESIGAVLSEAVAALRERLSILRDNYGQPVESVEALLSRIPTPTKPTV